MTDPTDLDGSIELDIVHHVGVLRINRPGRRNALTPGMVHMLNGHLTSLAGGSDVRVLILTGVDGAFCAGADLGSLSNAVDESPAERREYIEDEGQAVIRNLLRLPFPTIAAVDGPAVGMGFDMALACDMRIFGPRGWAMQGWGRLGLVAGTGGTLLLNRIVGSRAWRLISDQSQIDPPTAASLGLADKARSLSALTDAEECAARLARMSPDALACYVEDLRGQVAVAIDEHLHRVAGVQARLLGSAEFAHALKELRQ